MNESTYKAAGVDLDLYADAMRRLPAMIRSTHRPGVLELPGGFAGLFALSGSREKFDDPVLVSGSDGVGTKLKVAQLAGRFDTIGIDLVAMCVNDCLCLGAEPLFFLDYLALGQDDPELIGQLVAGVAAGCRQAGAALLGGETAIMPDVYEPGGFDLAGFCVGVADRSRLIDGSRIAAGDQLIGVASSGFHSNGYSLIRKIVFERAGLTIDSPIDELKTGVGDLLLRPTVIYAETVRHLLETTGHEAIHGMAHITGGGLRENLHRILPDDCSLLIEPNSWPRPDAYQWLQELGEVEDAEMERVFNMGIGYVFVVEDSVVEAALRELETVGMSGWRIGKILKG